MERSTGDAMSTHVGGNTNSDKPTIIVGNCDLLSIDMKTGSAYANRLNPNSRCNKRDGKEIADPSAHSGKAVTALILIGTVDAGSTLVPPGASAI